MVTPSAETKVFQTIWKFLLIPTMNNATLTLPRVRSASLLASAQRKLCLLEFLRFSKLGLQTIALAQVFTGFAWISQVFQVLAANYGHGTNTVGGQNLKKPVKSKQNL